jgi:hypothetical protein
MSDETERPTEEKKEKPAANAWARPLRWAWRGFWIGCMVTGDPITGVIGAVVGFAAGACMDGVLNEPKPEPKPTDKPTPPGSER